MTTRTTEEQKAIIDSPAESLVVNAFAGTGKTTTLVEFAKARPDKRMLYLAFNKSVAEETRGRFPANVDAKTSHALAFAGYGVKYKDKLGSPRAFHARNVLRPKNMHSDDALLFSSIALDGVNRFLMSSAPEITVDHLLGGRRREGGPSPSVIRGFDAQDLLQAAKTLWERMRNPDDHAMPMPHDGYLKLYQLSRPNLGKYDYILLDEAQDTNPCLFGLFAAQETGKVLVGDEHQNIYTFRGAMNAMKRMKGERHALTASFRFGQPVAEVANTILGVFKEEKLRLRGLGGPTSTGKPEKGLETVFLHRTNAGLFDRAVELLNANKAMHFVGGVKNYNFETILDVWRLMDEDHKSIRDPFVKSFNAFDDLVDYAETVEDMEIKARIKVVMKYTFRIPRLIERLEKADVPDASKADASLTTAHKSKGLEWEQVVLGDDFPALMDEASHMPLSERFLPTQSEAEPLSADEANLIYVAATRARKNLVLNGELEELMRWGRRNPF